VEPIVAMLLGVLKGEALKLGSGLIEKGLGLVERRLTGKASDVEIMAWLRDVQDGKP
jgi:hypothetical protein